MTLRINHHVFDSKPVTQNRAPSNPNLCVLTYSPLYKQIPSLILAMGTYIPYQPQH